jgi:hypothetical protein
MILYPSPFIIENLGNCIFPMRDCSHSMEKLGAFIPKSHFRGFIYVLPIYIFVMKELLQLSFDQAPQVDF